MAGTGLVAGEHGQDGLRDGLADQGGWAVFAAPAAVGQRAAGGVAELHRAEDNQSD
jgi:hypothetical protein